MTAVSSSSDEAIALRARRARARRRPMPRPRSGRRSQPAQRGKLRRGQTVRSGGPELGEQAEFDAEVDEPGPVEPGQAVDEFVEAVVEAHRRRIVARPAARSRPAGTRRVPYGSDATVRADARFWGSMDTDSQLIAALARDLDGAFEALVLAHQDRLYSIALRMLGDARDAEEAAQDAFVRAYRALAGYRPRPDPASSGFGRGWRPSCSTCAGRGSARRAAAGRPPLSLDAAEPGHAWSRRLTTRRRPGRDGRTARCPAGAGPTCS